MPEFVSQEWVDSLKSVSFRADDVWIVSFPKSGNTWTEQIVKLVRDGGIDDGEMLSNSVPYLEAFNDLPRVGYRVDIDALPSPRAFKSHFTYSTMPCGPPHSTSFKYIYVARNPKDVVTSMFNYFKTFAHVGKFDKDWDEHFQWCIKGFVVDSWFEHVLSFWHHRDDQNVLFLKYEDMKKDLPTAVTTIARFMGYDLTQDVIDKIVLQSDIKSMKSKRREDSDWECGLRQTQNPKFFHKGVVGEWKNHFTAEQSAQFDTLYTERMEGSGLDFEFE